MVKIQVIGFQTSCFACLSFFISIYNVIPLLHSSSSLEMSIVIPANQYTGLSCDAHIRTVIIDDVRHVSAIDVVKLATTPNTNPHDCWMRTTKLYPDLLCGVKHHKFPGAGQRETATIDARCVMILLNSIPGKNAANFKRKHADKVVRYFGGDDPLSEGSMYQLENDEGDHLRISGEAAVFPKVLTSVTNPHICSVCDLRRLVRRINVTPAFRILVGLSYIFIYVIDQSLMLKASDRFAKTLWSLPRYPVTIAHSYWWWITGFLSLPMIPTKVPICPKIFWNWTMFSRGRSSRPTLTTELCATLPEMVAFVISKHIQPFAAENIGIIHTKTVCLCLFLEQYHTTIHVASNMSTQGFNLYILLIWIVRCPDHNAIRWLCTRHAPLQPL